MCNRNCNQGRACTCCDNDPRQPLTSEERLFLIVLLVLVYGTVGAIVYGVWRSLNCG